MSIDRVLLDFDERRFVELAAGRFGGILFDFGLTFFFDEVSHQAENDFAFALVEFVESSGDNFLAALNSFPVLCGEFFQLAAVVVFPVT